MSAMGENKRAFYMQDFQDWLKWTNKKFTFNTHFPINTVLPLRVALSKLEHGLIDLICT